MATSTKKKEQPGGLNVIATAELINYINLDDLLPNPYQPETRIEVSPDTAKKFAYSIQEHGLIQMPVVRPGKEDGKYEVGDGWLRRAGYLFNLKEFNLQEYSRMPCLVKELTDQQMADMVMEANTVRQDLNPIELAKLYKKYLEDFKIPQVELARRHNCSQGEIANTIRLLELPDDIQGKIISQEISETHGRHLLRLNNNAELQQKVLARAIKDGYSVNQLSDQIRDEIYRDSENLDPNDYPKPTFDVTECEKCPSRQKIGTPYSNEKKVWRCLDKECYQKKTDQAEKARVKQMQEEIAAAKKVTGEGKGEKKDGILDLSKLTWRDYQELDSSIHKIDKSECRNCPNRAVGKTYGSRLETVCINVQCFKEKERTAQKKEAMKAQDAERLLTQRVKEACANLRDESTPFELIVGYLLGHCRKDTREKFGRMYDIKESEISHWYAVNIPANEPEVIIRTAALVLTLERYEGEKGVFQKMLADLEGNSADLDKALDSHRAKHCKNCVNDNDDRTCRYLLKRYGEGWNDKCYHKKTKEGDEAEEVDESVPVSTVTPSIKTMPADTQKAITEMAGKAAKQLRAKEFKVDKADLGEQELLSFQFKYCDGCYWADQAKVGTGNSCCTFITTPHIVDGECWTRQVKNSKSDNTSDSKDSLASLLIQSANDGKEEHIFKLGELEVKGSTLRGCTLALGKHLGWGSTAEDILLSLKKLPAAPNTELLVSILEERE